MTAQRHRRLRSDRHAEETKLCGRSGASGVLATATTWPFGRGIFECVLSAGRLHHLPDDGRATLEGLWCTRA